MSNEFTVIASRRTEQGKGASRRLRRLANQVPAIVYGGEATPEMLSIDHNHLLKHLDHEAFYSHILVLNIDGKTQRAVLRDLHRHPYKPRILHADFQRVTGKEKIAMHVPLHFKGEDVCPGVIDDKGIVSHLLTEIEVRCLPNDLPEFIEVDISKLKLGESIHLSHIKLPKGVESVELAHHKDPAVAHIEIPRAAIEEEQLEAAEAAAAAAAAPAPSEVPTEPKGKEKAEAEE